MPRFWTVWVLPILGLAACQWVTTESFDPVLVAQFEPQPVSPDENHLVYPSVPAPSDLLLDPVTGKANLPLEYSLAVLGRSEPLVVPAFSTPAAARFVSSFLNTLHGFLPSVATEFTVTGAVDPASVNDQSLLVLDITRLLRDAANPGVDPVAGHSFAVTELESGARSRISVIPPATGWTSGHTYLFVATSKILGAGGEALSSNYIFNLFKSTAPLARNGLSVCALPDAQAVELEAGRAAMAPLFGFLEAESAGPYQTTRDEVAILWTLTIHPEATAVNDPSASAVPMPTDLLMTSALTSTHDCDEDGEPDCVAGHLCLPVDCATASPAEKDFVAYMNSLDGWPATMAISTDFSGAIDTESLAGDAVRLVRVDLSPATQVEGTKVWASHEDTRLNLQAPGWLVPGGRYAAVVSRALRSAGGQYPVVPSLVTGVALLPDSLVDTAGASQMKDFGLDDVTAQTLEGLRLWIQGLLAALGLESNRESLAQLWSFTIHSGNEALYDPTRGVVPMPNDLAMALDDQGNPVHVNLPVDPAWPAVQKAMVEQMNRLDGFSPLGSIATPFLRPLEEGSFQWLKRLDMISMIPSMVVHFNGRSEPGLGDVSLALVDVTEVDPTSATGLLPLLDAKNIFDENELSASFADGMLVFTPRSATPLPEGRRFMALAFSTLNSAEKDDDGSPYPIRVSPTFQLARTPWPLADGEGTSQVSTLTDPEASMLEMLRGNYAPIFDALNSIGVAREEVLMFWTFTTQTISDWMEGLMVDVLAKGDIQVSQGDLVVPAASPWKDNLKNASLVVDDGLFQAWQGLVLDNPEVPGGLLPGYFAQDEDGKVLFHQEELPFILALPKAEDGIEAPHPVVILAHGFFGDRTKLLVHADTFLAEGFAVLTLDLPYHGQRSLPGEESGTGFLGADVVADRDHFAQAILDVLQAIELVHQPQGLNAWLQAQTGTAGLLDPSRIHLVGDSLGGVVGVPAAALSTKLHSAAFVAVGGHLTRVLTETQSGWLKDPIFEALEGMGIAAGTAAFRDFLGFAQMLLDRIDPIYFARKLAKAPEASGKPVLFIQGTADTLFPEATTTAIHCAARSDKSFVQYLDGMCHQFFVSPCAGDPERKPEAALAAQHIAAFFKSGGDGQAVPGAVGATELNCDAL